MTRHLCLVFYIRIFRCDNRKVNILGLVKTTKSYLSIPVHTPPIALIIVLIFAPESAPISPKYIHYYAIFCKVKKYNIIASSVDIKGFVSF